MWLAALLMGFTLFGWASWKDGTGIRALATFALYAALIGLFGRVDTFYWGLMVAPAILIGLAFAPDGLQGLDRRGVSQAAQDHRDEADAMKRILLIVGGGIAAYKACELIRLARKADIGVKCVLTASGAQFITPMTLAALVRATGLYLALGSQGRDRDGAHPAQPRGRSDRRRPRYRGPDGEDGGGHRRRPCHHVAARDRQAGARRARR